jgi:hypothetical protein
MGRSAWHIGFYLGTTGNGFVKCAGQVLSFGYRSSSPSNRYYAIKCASICFTEQHRRSASIPLIQPIIYGRERMISNKPRIMARSWLSVHRTPAALGTIPSAAATVNLQCSGD